MAKFLLRFPKGLYPEHRFSVTWSKSKYLLVAPAKLERCTQNIVIFNRSTSAAEYSAKKVPNVIPKILHAGNWKFDDKWSTKKKLFFRCSRPRRPGAVPGLDNEALRYFVLIAEGRDV